MLYGTQKINTNGNLEIGGCDTVDLAQKYGTPLYVLDEMLVRQHCREYIDSFKKYYPNSKIAFAGKAFLTMAMCRILDQEGMHLDVVSSGELYTALKADFPVERIYFHGNYKSEGELRLALDSKVGKIVVDNMLELELLNSIAMEKGVKAHILFRLTPGIDPHTHRLIRTGQADTKFGLNIKDGSAMAAIKKALQCEGIVLAGIHCHAGSQLLELDAHQAAVKIMVEFAKQVLDETGHTFDEINTGGGLGISYIEGQVPPMIDSFAKIITDSFLAAFDEFGLAKHPTIVQEPGRSIVGTAGCTLYTVGPIKTVSIKEDPGHRTYVAIDGGMSDNPRPQLYQAIYEALVANNPVAEKTETYTISGKHCETDTMIVDASLPKLHPGDLLAVQCTGAYNYAMASNYNRFCRPSVVLVADGESHCIVRRETLDDLVAQDVIPAHLAK
jgi:diaminopimelate decarboxylase